MGGIDSNGGVMMTVGSCGVNCDEVTTTDRAASCEVDCGNVTALSGADCVLIAVEEVSCGLEAAWG